MSITIADVEKIAYLAKLKFTEAEKEKLAEELSRIVTYVANLNELDLENVPATAHVFDLANVMRNDEVKHWLSQGEALMNAPETHKGFFSVPKVISSLK